MRAIDAAVSASMARTMLLPAAVQWQAALEAAGGGTGVGRLKEELGGLVDEFAPIVAEFHEAIKGLEQANEDPGLEGMELAHYMRDTVIGAMDEVRAVADKLEKLVADDLWPLPKYSEILFIK